jgi:uncharacterized membrane protein YccC
MSNIKRLSAKLRTWTRQHRVQLGLSLRVTVGALVSLALAQYFHLALPLWAVLTSVIVTQMSVGRSLKATIDYLAGTLGGAIVGGAIAVLIPHEGEWALLAVLALAVAPLALVAAINPTLSTAPVTAVIVLLVPAITHASPIGSAIDRVLEVALGAVTGLTVSFLLLPSSAHGLVIAAASRILEQIAQALDQLSEGLTHGLDVDALHRIQDGIGEGLNQLQAICSEAERERSARLTAEPDTGPLRRMLLRVRHDLVIIGRAAVRPLPEPLQGRLAPALKDVSATASTYLRSNGAALLGRRNAPSPDRVNAALDAYAAEAAALRSEGLTRGLSADDAERFFTLGFALEQLRQNFVDLERCVTEWARTPAK